MTAFISINTLWKTLKWAMFLHTGQGGCVFMKRRVWEAELEPRLMTLVTLTVHGLSAERTHGAKYAVISPPPSTVTGLRRRITATCHIGITFCYNNKNMKWWINSSCQNVKLTTLQHDNLIVLTIKLSGYNVMRLVVIYCPSCLISADSCYVSTRAWSTFTIYMIKI